MSEWTEYVYERAPRGALCRFRNPYREWVGYADFPDEFNIANLEWKLTGIGIAQMNGRLPGRVIRPVREEAGRKEEV